MIQARRALLSHARGMFETHLPGVFSWDAVNLDAPEPLPKLPNGRRNPIGKYAERVSMSFGDDFKLLVQSPEDDPPLGWVKLYHHGKVEAEGPLDAVVWANIGSAIRQRCGYGGR